MNIQLTPYEARVIGCLLEKERTTPEHYPLSLNALVNACNQKSSRDPILSLDAQTVQAVMDGLLGKRLVSEKSGFGSRVAKYQHRFCNTDFGELKFTDQELGVVCVLLLRGPQTAGELRLRSERLCKFKDVPEVEGVLERLMTRDDGPFVARLPREPGRREARYAHLFCGEVEGAQAVADPNQLAAPMGPPARERLGVLEAALQALQSEVAEIRRRLDSITADDQKGSDS